MELSRTLAEQRRVRFLFSISHMSTVFANSVSIHSVLITIALSLVWSGLVWSGLVWFGSPLAIPHPRRAAEGQIPLSNTSHVYCICKFGLHSFGRDSYRSLPGLVWSGLIWFGPPLMYQELRGIRSAAEELLGNSVRSR
jgi:hypothetical protein